MSWPTVWKTLAWSHSRAPSLIRDWEHGRRMRRRVRWEIEINIRRKVGGIPKIGSRKEWVWNEATEKRMGKWQASWGKANSGQTELCLYNHPQLPQSFWPYLCKNFPWQLYWSQLSHCYLFVWRFSHLSAPRQMTMVSLRETFLSAVQGSGPQKDLEGIG